MSMTYTEHMTDRQRANLAALALGLSRLPETYARFDMADYFESCKLDESLLREAKQHPVADAYMLLAKYAGHCGTTACACGHGPSMGIGMDLIESGLARNWEEYAFEAFGAKLLCGIDGAQDRRSQEKAESDLSHILWSWCFSSSWGREQEDVYVDDGADFEQADNTPHGAACRIVAALEGNIPDEYVEACCTPSCRDNDYAAEELVVRDYALNKSLPYDNDHTKVYDRLNALGLAKKADAVLAHGQQEVSR